MSTKSLFCISLPFLFSIISCVTTKQFKAPFKEEQIKGRDTKNEVFVETKSGERIVGDKITYSNTGSGNKKQYWTTIGNRKIKSDEVAYTQTDGVFKARAHSAEYSDIEVTRLRAGKINLYYFEHPAMITGPNTYDVRGAYHIYYFEKQKGHCEPLYFDTFSKALSDNSEALRKFSQFFPKSKIPMFDENGNLTKLLSVVDFYNKQ